MKRGKGRIRVISLTLCGTLLVPPNSWAHDGHEHPIEVPRDPTTIQHLGTLGTSLIELMPKKKDSTPPVALFGDPKRTGETLETSLLDLTTPASKGEETILHLRNNWFPTKLDDEIANSKTKQAVSGDGNGGKKSTGELAKSFNPLLGALNGNGSDDGKDKPQGKEGGGDKIPPEIPERPWVDICFLFDQALVGDKTQAGNIVKSALRDLENCGVTGFPHVFTTTNIPYKDPNTINRQAKYACPVRQFQHDGRQATFAIVQTFVDDDFTGAIMCDDYDEEIYNRTGQKVWKRDVSCAMRGNPGGHGADVYAQNKALYDKDDKTTYDDMVKNFKPNGKSGVGGFAAPGETVPTINVRAGFNPGTARHERDHTNDGSHGKSMNSDGNALPGLGDDNSKGFDLPGSSSRPGYTDKGCEYIREAYIKAGHFGRVRPTLNEKTPDAAYYTHDPKKPKDLLKDASPSRSFFDPSPQPPSGNGGGQGAQPRSSTPPAAPQQNAHGTALASVQKPGQGNSGRPVAGDGSDSASGGPAPPSGDGTGGGGTGFRYATDDWRERDLAAAAGESSPGSSSRSSRGGTESNESDRSVTRATESSQFPSSQDTQVQRPRVRRANGRPIENTVASRDSKPETTSASMATSLATLSNSTGEKPTPDTQSSTSDNFNSRISALVQSLKPISEVGIFSKEFFRNRNTQSNAPQPTRDSRGRGGELVLRPNNWRAEQTERANHIESRENPTRAIVSTGKPGTR